jgi:hypothetical protein
VGHNASFNDITLFKFFSTDDLEFTLYNESQTKGLALRLIIETDFLFKKRLDLRELIL